MKLDPNAVNAAATDEFARLRREESMDGDPEGNVLLHGTRFNIMGADYFMADMYTELHDIYGDGAGGILRQTGEGYGEQLIELDDADNPDTRFGQFLGLLAFLGYSRIRVEDDRIIVPDSPTADEYVKNGGEPRTVCYFLAGLLSGAARVCNEPSNFVEERCRADGADHCIFVHED